MNDLTDEVLAFSILLKRRYNSVHVYERYLMLYCNVYDCVVSVLRVIIRALTCLILTEYINLIKYSTDFNKAPSTLSFCEDKI